MDTANILKGGLVITVHRDWLFTRKKRDNSGKRTQKIPDATPTTPKTPVLHQLLPQRLEFVNAVEPGRNRDEDVRKLVRRHVRQDHAVKVAQTKLRMGRHTPSASPLSPRFPARQLEHDSPWMFGSLGSPVALISTSYPIEMQGSTHILLTHYLRHTTTSSLHSVPTDLQLRPHAWFEFAITDAAMLHGILYAGALYDSLQHGQTESRECLYHQAQVVLLVNKRLSETTPIMDSTIGSITCLALGAAVSGNHNLWKVHMRGLQEMIRSRGDISSINPLLQSKIRRADITGAIDYTSTPYISFKRSSKPSAWSILPRQQSQRTRLAMSQILSSCGTHSRIIKLMTELANFLQVLQYNRLDALDLLEQDFYWIQHEFLAFPQTLGDKEEEGVDMALRMGSLLYMKSIMQEFPYSVIGDRILLQHLQTALTALGFRDETSEVQLWLSLIGAILSKNEKKDWFLERLVELVSLSGVDSFADERLALGKYLGLRDVFGKKAEKVWHELSVKRPQRLSREESTQGSVMFGS